jgi:hypothetical protein
MKEESVQVAEQETSEQFQRFPPFPPDARVLIEAQGLLKGRSVRINEVADVILEDPVATLELLSAANRKFHANERPAIWSVRTALFRLGTEQTLLLIDDLLARATLFSGPLRSEFEHLRLRARRTSLVARAIANEVAPQLTEECQTAGLVSQVGFMLALTRFKDRYLQVLSSSTPKGFAYKLEQSLKFDLEKFQLDYLTDRWFPPSLLFVFDKDISCKTESQANLRFAIEGAEELLEAIEAGKFDKYKPENELPPKSALRYLSWSPEGRESLYKMLVEVFGLRAVEVKTQLVPQPTEEALPSAVPPTPVFFSETQVEFIEANSEELERPLTHFSERNQRVLASLKDTYRDSENPRDLIRGILRILTDDGPFIRASLLMFDRSKGAAQVLLPTGGEFEMPNPISVLDPLSPVATSNTQIRSFNAEDLLDELAPFGVAAYALSPLRVDSDKPVALYADCGASGVVPFESRRVFRVAVGLLNKALEGRPLALGG